MEFTGRGGEREGRLCMEALISGSHIKGYAAVYIALLIPIIVNTCFVSIVASGHVTSIDENGS